jgi:hypothetical protein
MVREGRRPSRRVTMVHIRTVNAAVICRILLHLRVSTSVLNAEARAGLGRPEPFRLPPSTQHGPPPSDYTGSPERS